jgi:hypothetical protein
VLHAVERQVVQAHLIVAVAHQHLGDGSRHKLCDRGRRRQLRGHRGGQQGQGAGGEGVAQDLALRVGVGGEKVGACGAGTAGSESLPYLEGGIEAAALA